MSDRATQMHAFLEGHLKGYTLHPLTGDASFRRYIRLKHQSESYMLMDAPPDKEDIRSFIHVCNLLLTAGYSAPRMIAVDEIKGFLLLEDLGDDTFSRLLRVDISRQEEYYTEAVKLLARWHSGGFSIPAGQLPDYNQTLLMKEVMLFSDWFLPQVIEADRLAEAQQSYVELWEKILARAPLSMNQFVHRDYHADNLMWLGSRDKLLRIGLLDFQDAVRGDAAYDMVSLLEDARRDVPKPLVEKLIVLYLRQYKMNEPSFREAYAVLAAQRNSKIIGIFTRLAARDKKEHYLKMLPRVWRHLEYDSAQPPLAPLKQWLDKYVSAEARGVLTIRKDAAQLGLVA